MSNRPTQIKLCLLGDAAVGKSSIVLRYSKNQFDENKESTIGAAFLTQKCRLPEDPQRVVKFAVWDTAGQERFQSLAPMYYRNAQAAIIVYDATVPKTLEKAKYWINELRVHGKMVLALAGNKIDLANVSSELHEHAARFARENQLLFFETSAKTGANIIEMFTDIARYLPSNLFESRTASAVNTPSVTRRGFDFRVGSADEYDASDQCAC